MSKTVFHFFIAACFSLFFFTPAYTQHLYQVNHYTTENGLPSNGIKGLQWDESTGFLWIATEAGVVRYNGMNFTTFDITTNPEFGSNRIVSIAKNYEGKILIAGEEGNLSLVKDNKISLWFDGLKLPKYDYNYYCTIAASDTLFRQGFKNPWSELFSILYNTTVVPVNDTACAVVANGLLYYYSVSTLQPKLIESLPLHIRKAFTIDGQLYFFDASNKLYAYDLFKNSFIQYALTDEYGSSFNIQKENSSIFWEAGMETPVIVQQGKAWIPEKMKGLEMQCRLVAEGLPENTLLRFAQYKKSGNYLFLGSASKGIYVIHRNQLVSRQPDVLDINQTNSFYSQIELPDGNILTNTGVIIGNNPAHSNFNISPHFLNSVYELTDSVLIYGSHDSVFSYNKKTFNSRLLFVSAINENFSVAFSGSDLYFASQKGIAVIRKNGALDFVKKFNTEAGVRFVGIYKMIEIAPGKLALATCDGLLGFDTRTHNIDTLLKIPSVCIRSLYKEGDYIFIGTYGDGYYILKNGILKPMPLDINLYLKYTHCFMKDDSGFCWISTNNGLFKVKMSDMLEAYEKDIPQIYYHYLGKDEGMQTTEMNGGCIPCAIRLSNNNFSFPTMDGLLQFDPSTTNIELPSGKIYIDKIIADSKDLKPTGDTLIQLPENAKKLDITFALNAWCRKENLYIDYKMNDDKWLPVEVTAGQPKISFSNMGYGTYILQIRKMNGFGVNNYSYTNISFTIATPFYQQWWFRIICLLALAGIGYLIFKWRLRQYAASNKKLERLVEQKTMDLNLKNIQLEKNNRIKLRLISIINHDIMTPLKFMHYAGKALVENKENIKAEDQFETISEITQTAKDMEQLSSQILNWIIYHNPDHHMQKEEFDLHQLVEMVLRVLHFSAKAKNTKLQNDIPVNFTLHQYLEPMRVMIYNIVLNSLNFTRNGIISVYCNHDENKIILHIKDTGVGMTDEQVANLLSEERIIASVNIDNKKGTGLGYLIIKDLLNMMEGTLFIKSTKDYGTTVSVSLPSK